jgi:four helix bundle protein
MAIYQRIRAWERCHELCVAVYQTTGRWPPEERFGLISQARRAAHSAAANIAEGCAPRRALPSSAAISTSAWDLSELSYTLLLAKELNLISDGEWRRLDGLHQRAGGMTWLLYKSLVAKKATVIDSR